MGVFRRPSVCTTWSLGCSSIAMSLGDPSDMTSTALKHLLIGLGPMNPPRSKLRGITRKSIVCETPRFLTLFPL